MLALLEQVISFVYGKCYPRTSCSGQNPLATQLMVVYALRSPIASGLLLCPQFCVLALYDAAARTVWIIETHAMTIGAEAYVNRVHFLQWLKKRSD